MSIDVFVLTNFTFPCNVVICSYCPLTILYILVRVCIWALGFYKLEVLGALVGSLEFCYLVCGKVIVLLSLVV